MSRLWPWIAIGAVAALACVVYVPFLQNPRVFDDWVFFSGLGFEYYATHPFGLEMRTPAYFTLAITETEIGGMQAHRIVSLAFHVGCSLAICKLIHDLLRAAVPSVQGSTAILWGSVGGALFAVHPVAVYGAGYLVERTIVLATLFSLFSVVLFVRGLVRRRYADALSAALMYWVAVLSKEHSVLLPAVAVIAATLVLAERRFAIRYAATYLAVCAPVALFVVVARKWVLGHGYEPDFAPLANQLEGVFGQADGGFSWAMSAITQAGLFFKYLAIWLWPDTGTMSIDVRVDFLETWSAGWITFKLVAFLAFGALSMVLLLRRGRAGVVGFGMLYAWIQFMVEMSTARFQEPFVLYRSYLWAPGFMISLAAMLSAAPVRAALAASALAVPLLVYQARDRLTTFSSSLRLWEDAYAKLPDKAIPWGSRTLYMVGREYAYSGQAQKAIEVAERCIAQYPNTVHCYFSRGFTYFLLGQYDRALPDLRRAVELRPDSGVGHHRLGLVLERLGRIGEAKAEYTRASDLGFKSANQELKRLARDAAGESRAPAAPR